MKRVAEVLEGLREEERRLSVELSGVRRAIAALEEVIGGGAAQGAVLGRIEGSAQAQSGLSAPEAGAPPLPDTPGPYAILSFYQAAAVYLAEAGEPRTPREIAAALLAGGYPTRAKDFTATVRTMLLRPLSAEEFGIFRNADGRSRFERTPDLDESPSSDIA